MGSDLKASSLGYRSRYPDPFSTILAAFLFWGLSLHRLMHFLYRVQIFPVDFLWAAIREELFERNSGLLYEQRCQVERASRITWFSSSGDIRLTVALWLILHSFSSDEELCSELKSFINLSLNLFVSEIQCYWKNYLKYVFNSSVKFCSNYQGSVPSNQMINSARPHWFI